MKKYYLLSFTIFLLFITFNACSDQENEYIAVSPVVVDLTKVPYPKLSDYKFFE